MKRINEEGRAVVSIRIWNVDQPLGASYADVLGVMYTPTVYVEGVKIPNELLEDEETLYRIIVGEQPIEYDREENVLNATTRIRRVG